MISDFIPNCNKNEKIVLINDESLKMIVET